LELIGFTGRESHKDKCKMLNLRDRVKEEVDFRGLSDL